MLADRNQETSVPVFNHSNDVRVVSDRQREVLRRTVSDLVDAAAAADSLHMYEHLVPPELATALSEHTRTPVSDSGFCVIEGILSDFVADPGPTPKSWDFADFGRTRHLDVAFALVASTAGRVFGWKSQQDGRLVHDVVPSREFAGEQVGASSAVRLEWHTEDSYHPERPELLLLACVRNPDEVGTDVSSIRQADVSQGDVELLSTVPVLLCPDDSFAGSWEGEDAARMLTLWESAHGLRMRYDPPYTRLPEGTAGAAGRLGTAWRGPGPLRHHGGGRAWRRGRGERRHRRPRPPAVQGQVRRHGPLAEAHPRPWRRAASGRRAR
ncbi:hypothetical protein [Lentzea sp. NPDC059081]|uniref:hypothetical protein n=1 Tax=Lentzea sp. NPDC059081 TaxID=3346719 RepID=UPI003676EA73